MRGAQGTPPVPRGGCHDGNAQEKLNREERCAQELEDDKNPGASGTSNGDRFYLDSSAGAGKTCALSMRAPNPRPQPSTG